VTEKMQMKKYEVTFQSLFQTGDGTGRNVTLKLVRLSGAGAGSTASGAVAEEVGRSEGSYHVHGVVVPEMNPFVYLGLLFFLGLLLTLPSGLRRLWRPSGGI
jgi:hypothetical protein